MATPKRGPRLGGGPAHQKQILANQASDLFRYGRLRTTEAKAKALRPYAERLITKAKQGDLHSRRQVLSKLHDRDVVAYLFEDVAPRFTDRNGGYTRILKLGPRRGDNARLALIELVDRGEQAGDEIIEESKQSRMRGLFGRRRRARQEAATTGGAYVDEFDEDAYVEEELTDEQVAAAVREATGSTPVPTAADPAGDESAADGTGTADEDVEVEDDARDDAAGADDQPTASTDDTAGDDTEGEQDPAGPTKGT